uniref:Cation_ATPase_N domain-containing protein n=1 Tax=Macrostomum lignano TaxID=282301 RepID=A0A1I8IZH8_9PLAT
AGDSHGVEDAEKRREELQRANAAAGEKPGQLNQEEFLHGVLMHGDAKAGSAHSHDPAPTVEKRPVQNGPMNQEDLMHGVLMHGDSNPDHKHRHSQADQAVLKAGGAPATECRRRVATFSEDEGLLGRWWRTLKYLVTGSGDSDSGKGGSRPTSAADFNLMQDLAAVGSTKTVAELDQAAGHSHRDTDKVHRERDRREHANTVHVEH